MIKDNIASIRKRIAASCFRAGRDPSSVKIVAVSKASGIEEIREAVSCGITDIGENKVQEALQKNYELRFTDYGLRIKWHMVGHLQRNKVKDAVRIFDLIHSVDSLRLAEKIDAEAGKISKVQDILLEIKTSPEAAKSGLSAQEAGEVVEKIADLKNIRLNGFMTIAPAVNNPEEARPYFRMLKDLRDKINDLRHLSMGMTDDFEIAIEEGADIIRVGRGVFGS